MTAACLLGLLALSFTHCFQGLVRQEIVEDQIQKLGSDKIDERGKAATELKAMGVAALPALQESLKSKDPEVATRVREVMDSIHHENVLKAFRKIEAVLERASTIAISSECNGPKQGPRLYNITNAKVLLDKGNKVNVLVKQFGGTKKGFYLILSDGKRVWSFADVTDVESAGESVPPTLTEDAIAFVVRVGLGPIPFSTIRPSEQEKLISLAEASKVFAYSELSEGVDENLNTMSYRMKAKDGTDAAVKLWYEGTSGRLVKRTITQGNKAQGNESAIEIYREFALNGELPAGTFVLPGKD